MSAAPMPPDPRSGPRSGWLLVRGDGLVMAADPGFASLVGAPDPAALVGRYWPSLVTDRAGQPLQDAERAVATGQRWSGALELIFADRPVDLELEVLVASVPDDVVLMRAVELVRDPPPEEATAVDASETAELRALVAAMEAVEALFDPAAAARSVLQAVHPRLPFDWAIALLLGAEGAEVLCTYPAAMAGIQPGGVWSPLDSAERYLLTSGEPSLTGELAVSSEDSSPLARLAGFGMRSALRVPLYGGDRVRACVSLFSHQPNAFTPADGVRLDRFVRPLGQLLRERPATLAPAEEGRTIASAPAPTAADVREPPSLLAELETVLAPSAGTSETDSSVAQSERLAAIGELVSGVAHELNNPLTAILGYAQMLPTLEGSDREQALTTIEQEAMRASRIVRNLLSFARQHRPRVEPVDVNAVLERVVEVRRYNLAMDNVTIVSHLGDVPGLMADEYQLEQVFLHLVNNAHQALQADGGTITLTTGVVGDYARVTVADTGAGIPDDVAPRIFDPFFTTREVGRGSGMGLAIVYGTVTEHGGRVWAERSPSGGAQFVVELPLPGAPTAIVDEGPPALQQRPLEGRGEHMLVVDDEMSIRMLTREILGTSGYVVDIAASGEEALERLEEARYDLVIADVRMPGMDGVDLHARIRERWPELLPQLIFITGDTESERTATLLREEGVQHLEKPFHTAQLLRSVREVLDRS